jgi:hypothetical protein
VEFAYNRSVHGAIKFSPFEVVYGFNPCVPIDLVHIPIDERTSMDGIRKAELMKKLHEQVRLHIEEKTIKYAKQANNGRKMVRFEHGDLVWIHIRKGRFPSKHKSKLMPKVDGPFRIIEKLKMLKIGTLRALMRHRVKLNLIHLVEVCTTLGKIMTSKPNLHL